MANMDDALKTGYAPKAEDALTPEVLGDTVKVLCHAIISQWAEKQGVEIEPAALANSFADVGLSDQKWINVALRSFTQAARNERQAATSAKPTEVDTHQSDTAQVILNTSAQVFLERGYDVSLDEIAAAASITKPTIYSYFKNKKELFRAVMAKVAADMVPKIDPPSLDKDLREELIHYGQAFRNIILSRTNLLAFRAALVNMKHIPDLGEMMTSSTIREINASLAGFFSEAMEAGLIRRVDPFLLSEHFFAATAGQSRTRMLMGLGPDSPERSREYLEQFVDCFISGIRP